MRLTEADYAALDYRLAKHDAYLRARYPGDRGGRQPVHTVYIPADKIGGFRAWGMEALAAMKEFSFDFPHAPAVRDKLTHEPIEDLRVDFEDGYGVRDDDQEDAAVREAAAVLLDGEQPPFVGIRIKSLEAPTRRRALRTLDLFLEHYPLPFVVTLPKVSGPDQVSAMVVLCSRLEKAYERSLAFEIQIELPAAIVGANGRAVVARLINAAAGRCVGLHFGTYDYTSALGIAAGRQSLDHPAADYAKSVMQAAAAQTGVRLSDGSSNVLPVGSPEEVLAAWQSHHRLVSRSLARGFYQGWDLHPAQLPTRYSATYEFFVSGRDVAVERLQRYLSRQESGIADEPATARALAGYLLRGLDCGALDDAGFPRSDLVGLATV
jgi:citrate lyase beta subunit